MAYEKTDWVPFETVVSADKLNKIERQLESITLVAETNEQVIKSMAETIASYVAHPAVATTTNSDNDYAVTLDPAPSEYVNGMGLVVTINADSTAAATINVNGLGAIPIKKANGNPVNNLKANGVYTLRYSSAQSGFILQGEGGEYGNALATDVIEGKTIGTENGIITGSIPLRHASNGIDDTGNNHHHASQVSIVPGALHFKPNPLDNSRVAYEGDTWVSHYDSSLDPNNIISGKPILGVNGNIPNYGRQALAHTYVFPESYRADGFGSLVIEPKWGYYEAGLNVNGFGSIQVMDGNFKATSIIKGKSIFGLDGVAESAKRKASGTVTSGSHIIAGVFNKTTGDQIQSLTVTGLTFKPNIILLWTDDGINGGVYEDKTREKDNANVHPFHSVNAHGGKSTYAVGRSALYVNNTGFVLASPEPGTYNWLALEL